MLTSRLGLASVACTTLLLSTSCEPEWHGGGIPHRETRSVALDRSEFVRANLRMGAGELRIRGGASELMEGEFSYDRMRMHPEVHYNSGLLTVEEPSGFHSGRGPNRWDLAFNNEKPLDLEINFGAGSGRLNLASLSLRRVDIHMGVGHLEIDLRGEPKEDYSLSLNGGIGDATVYLPEHAGVVADVKGGIGGIDARGLSGWRGRYVNAAYGHAKTTVRLDIRGGIGAIHLIGD